MDGVGRSGEKARTIDHLATRGVLRVEKQIDPASYSVKAMLTVKLGDVQLHKRNMGDAPFRYHE